MDISPCNDPASLYLTALSLVYLTKSDADLREVDDITVIERISAHADRLPVYTHAAL